MSDTNEENFKSLDADFEKLLANATSDSVEKNLLLQAERVRKRAIAIAKERIPQRTGAHLSSLIVTDKKGLRKIDKTISKGESAGVVWQSKGFHGFFQEVGTVKNPARPHVRPAFDQLETSIIVEIQKKLTEV